MPFCFNLQTDMTPETGTSYSLLNSPLSQKRLGSCPTISRSETIGGCNAPVRGGPPPRNQRWSVKGESVVDLPSRTSFGASWLIMDSKAPRTMGSGETTATRFARVGGTAVPSVVQAGRAHAFAKTVDLEKVDVPLALPVGVDHAASICRTVHLLEQLVVVGEGLDRNVPPVSLAVPQNVVRGVLRS